MSARGIRRAREREATRRGGRKGGLTAGALSAAATVALLGPAGASAATFEVTELGDNGGFVQDCTPAQCQLRAAIQKAGATPGADIITFASGLSGEILLNRSALRVQGTDALTIIGPGADAVSISSDRDQNNVLDLFHRCDKRDGRVFELKGSDPANPQEVLISGLTMREGVAPIGMPSNYTLFTDRNGGAVRSADTDLTITDSVISESIATGRGGAIYADRLTLEDTAVEGNRGFQGAGGIFISGTASSELSSSTITGNRAGVDTPDARFAIDDPFGGGILIEGNGGATLEDLEVTGNEASYSSGAPTGRGGGLALGSYGAPIVASDLTIAGNEALQDGGGALLRGRTELRSSAVTDNVAGRDGGGVNSRGSKILNSTLTGNEAGRKGGGVAAFDAPSGGAHSLIGSSTLTGNAAIVSGGGLHAYTNDTAELRSSIVAENTGNFDVATGSPGFPGAVDAEFSLIGTAEPGAVANDPSNILGEDPELGPLADNGGTTQSRLPDPGSPAIDAGNAGGLTLDQRGFARTQNQPAANAPGSDGTDIGAVELGPDTIAPDTTIDSGPPPNSTSGPYTFTFSSSEPGSTFECSLDGGAFSPCTSPKTFNSLPVGGHSLSVRAIDPSGNRDATAAAYRFTVSRAPVGDTTAPDTTITKVPKRILKRRGKPGIFVARFEGTDNKTPSDKLRFECSIDAKPYEVCATPFLGKVPEGRHTFAVRAVDGSGNADATPATATFKKVTKKARNGKKRGGGLVKKQKRC